MNDIKRGMIEFLSSVNSKIWFGDDDIVSVSTSKTFCVRAKNSASLFGQEFGSYDASQFLNALDLFEESDLEFDDPYIVMKDTKSRSKFYYNIADVECMSQIIENNERAKELLDMGDNEKNEKNKPYVKFKMDAETIKKMVSISSDHKIDVLQLKFDEVLKLSINEIENSDTSSQYTTELNEYEGTCGEFEHYISMKDIPPIDWDVYVFDDVPMLFLDNENYQMCIAFID